VNPVDLVRTFVKFFVSKRRLERHDLRWRPNPVAKPHQFRRNVLRGLAALALVAATAAGAVWGTA